MSKSVSPCVAAVLDDRSLSCLAHPNAEPGCWTAHRPPLCTACQNAATERQSISPWPVLCRVCEDLDGYVSHEAGTRPVVVHHCDAALMVEASLQAERRFRVLWAAAARVEVPSPVRVAARDGRPAREGLGVSWDSWRIAMGDRYRARVAEFGLWLAAVDPDGVGQRAAAMSRVEELVARARVADAYFKVRTVGEVWLPELRRRMDAARPGLDRAGEGTRALRALDNCELLVAGARSVLEPFHIRTLTEDMF